MKSIEESAELFRRAWRKANSGSFHSDDTGPFHRAWQRIRYGRRYSEAFEIARYIKRLRPKFRRAMESNGDVNLETSEARVALQMAVALFKAALTSSKNVREIAAALEAEKRKDPTQVNILRAYQACRVRRDEPPSLAQVKGAFGEQFGHECGRTDFGLRKTLRMLGLPLANTRPGRPRRSRAQIGNGRDQEQ